MIKIDCTRCDKKLTAPLEAEGRKGKCPDCGEILHLVIDKKFEIKDKTLLDKIDIKEESLREQVNEILQQNDYNICPYVKRIYDYMRMGAKDKDVAVQCFHIGTIHFPNDTCLSDFIKCEKFKQVRRAEDLLGLKR